MLDVLHNAAGQLASFAATLAEIAGSVEEEGVDPEPVRRGGPHALNMEKLALCWCGHSEGCHIEEPAVGCMANGCQCPGFSATGHQTGAGH